MEYEILFFYSFQSDKIIHFMKVKNLPVWIFYQEFFFLFDSIGISR
jgi:hypothetical protein